MTTSNAYAQSAGPTVTGTCQLNEVGHLNANFIVTNVDSNTFNILDVRDSSGTLPDTIHLVRLGEGSVFSINAKLGEQYTYNLYEDVDDDFRSVGLE